MGKGIKIFVQQKWCECKCTSNERACNSKQKCNHDEYWYEMIGVLEKTIIYGILVCVIVSVIRHVKFTNT